CAATRAVLHPTAATGWRYGPCTRSPRSSCGRGWHGAGRPTGGGGGRAARARPAPQLVRHEVISEGCHGAQSCQTDPKGAKRRLSDRPHVLVEPPVLVRVHRSNKCRACAALVHLELDLTAVRGLPGRVDGQ